MVLEKRNYDRQLLAVLDRIKPYQLSKQAILQVLVYVFVRWVVILPPLCMFGEFAVAQTYEHRLNGTGFERIRVHYYINDVEYKGNLNGDKDFVEICYWPKHPWIHDDGQHIRKLRNKLHISPKSIDDE